MGRDLVEIREAMEWAMKEMTRLKDHVDHQLDLRAPFAFLFNQITQDPGDSCQTSSASGDLAAAPCSQTFIQEDPGCKEPVGGEPVLG